MGNITKLNDILCYNINSISNVVAGFGGDLLKWDDNDFCLQSPTPTPTPTQTPGGASPTPTPTITPTITPSSVPCDPFCCEAELCYFNDCQGACDCNRSGLFYLSICAGQNCYLENATGIYTESRCGDPAPENYYADGTGCYYWDGSTTLTYNGPC
jgi:hypothetical protein